MTDKPAESAVERWERQYGPGSYGRALNWMACSNVFNSIDAALAELLDAIERLTATVDILTRSLNSHVGSASAKKCPVCNGSGGWYDYSRAVHGNYHNCHGCGGKGWVTT